MFCASCHLELAFVSGQLSVSFGAQFVLSKINLALCVFCALCFCKKCVALQCLHFATLFLRPFKQLKTLGPYLKLIDHSFLSDETLLHKSKDTAGRK